MKWWLLEHFYITHKDSICLHLNKLRLIFLFNSNGMELSVQCPLSILSPRARPCHDFHLRFHSRRCLLHGFIWCTWVRSSDSVRPVRVCVHACVRAYMQSRGSTVTRFSRSRHFPPWFFMPGEERIEGISQGRNRLPFLLQIFHELSDLWGGLLFLTLPALSISFYHLVCASLH